MKKTSTFQNALIWFGAGVSLAEILTGTAFAPLGMGKGLLAILIGHVIGCGMMLLAGLIGGRTGRSAMEAVKMSFGQKGGLLFALLNVLQLVGWTAIMIYDGALAIGGIFDVGRWVWCLVIGGLIILWIVVGVTDLGWINKITMAALFVLTLVLCGVFTALGLALIPAMLDLMNTPAEVLPESRAYLCIYFSGITGLLIYNMGSGILRAVGDSRRPFYFLVVSAMLNTGLDLLFVIRFHMGVAGVAWATIIAQAVSAVLVLAVLMRTDSCVRVELRRLRVHWDMLKKIVRVGIPAALQMAVTAFSNVFVQSYINHFGADCMSGWTAYTKIDQLMFLPMQSLALSATTFVGQNLGAGDTPRAQQGVRRALGISLAVTAVLMVPVLVLAPQLTAFFNRKAEVVAYGTLLLRYISPFYLLCCINQIYSGALRGAGNSQVPMVIMLGSFVVFRQIYLYIVSHFITNTLLPLAMGYPAGWLVCSAATLLYYRRAALGRQRLVEDN